MIYLATPYSPQEDEDYNVMYRRFILTRKYVAYAVSNFRIPLFSPIVHYHEIASKYNFPKDAEWWKDLNHMYMKSSEQLRVLQLNNWDFSKGVAMEIRWAEEQEIPILYVHPVDYATQKAPWPASSTQPI